MFHNVWWTQMTPMQRNEQIKQLFAWTVNNCDCVFPLRIRHLVRWHWQYLESNEIKNWKQNTECHIKGHYLHVACINVQFREPTTRFAPFIHLRVFLEHALICICDSNGSAETLSIAENYRLFPHWRKQVCQGIYGSHPRNFTGRQNIQKNILCKFYTKLNNQNACKLHSFAMWAIRFMLLLMHIGETRTMIHFIYFMLK